MYIIMLSYIQISYHTILMTLPIKKSQLLKRNTASIVSLTIGC